MKSAGARLFLIHRGLSTAAMFACYTLAALGGLLEPVSLPEDSLPPGSTGGGDSVLPLVSPDGRFVVFSSTAHNLVPGPADQGLPDVFPAKLNVFRHDRSNGTTVLISASADGLGGGDGDSVPLAISTNGQFVLFESTARNLVTNDPNGLGDIFLRDVTGGLTELISVSTQGDSGNGTSRGAVMTPDAGHIAFTSAATNLVAGDTNQLEDVFVRDRLAQLTVLVSVGATSTGSILYPSASEGPVLTPDGRYIAFFSTATNLVPGAWAAGEVFVRDTLQGVTYYASTNAKALLEPSASTSKTVSSGHRLSDDGRYVAFAASLKTSTVSSYLPGLLLRHDLQTGLTEVVHTNANIPMTRSAELPRLGLTPDGRFIAFIANTNTAGLSGTEATCVLHWDAQTAALTRVSHDLSNSVPARSLCLWPVLSPDGQQVAFLSSATNLTTNVLSGEFHLYSRDIPAGHTRLVDVSASGAGAGVDFTTIPCVDAGGSLVAFASPAPGLVPDDRNRGRDVFVRDLTSGTTELISARHPSLPSETPHGNSGLYLFSPSTNAGLIAFASDADDLVSNDTNGLRDVFVRDLLTGSNLLVSVAANGWAGAGFSSEPMISGDGRYVAFTSTASNLVTLDPNNAQDIFARDLLSGTTTLASASTATNLVSAGSDSLSPQLSEDGRSLLFQSFNQYLVNPSLSSLNGNLFFRNLQLGTNYALTGSGVTAASMTPDGRFVAFIGKVGSSSTPYLYVWDSQLKARIYTNLATALTSVSISRNGQSLAYWESAGLKVADRLLNTNWLVSTGQFRSPALAGMRFSDDGRFLAYAVTVTNAPLDTNTTRDVYLHDCLSRSNTLLSRSSLTARAGNGDSDMPAISPDGRFVAFRSAASDLVPGDNNGAPDLFLFDRVNQALALVSLNQDGNATANRRSLSPVFSADSAVLAFRSWASDVGVRDFNQGSDLWLLRLTPPPITDSDTDGMDDQWELDYFGTLGRDGTEDLDLDGAVDNFEFTTGTNPTNALSLFRAELEMGPAPGGLPVLNWPAAPGGAYRVQVRDDLGDGTWQDMETPVTLFGHTGLAADGSPGAAHRFYRIVLVQ